MIGSGEPYRRTTGMGGSGPASVTRRTTSEGGFRGVRSSRAGVAPWNVDLKPAIAKDSKRIPGQASARRDRSNGEGRQPRR